MPTVARQLGGFTSYSWAFTVYMLASTTVMPIYGKWADVFGRKRIFLLGMLLFLMGSLLCGFAGSMEQLIVYRGIQGLGAGALLPIAFTIAADLFPPEQRARFMSLFSAVFAFSSVCGPAVGGLLADWSWSLIFWINIPFGGAALIVMAVLLDEKRNPRPRLRHPMDWLGTFTLTGAVIGLQLALVMGGREYEWDSVVILGLLVGCACLMAMFIRIEMKAKEPLVPLSLFRMPTFAATGAAGFFVSAGMFGAIAYIPLFVQNVKGVQPAVTGYILTPLMLATVVTTMGSRRWMTRVSYRTILVPSLLMTLTGFLLFSQVHEDMTAWQLVTYMIVTGLGLGAVFPVIGTAAQHAVSWSQRGAATASNQFLRSIGGTFGVSIMGGMLPSQAEDSAVLSHAIGAMFLVGASFVTVGLLSSLAMGGAELTQAENRKGD
jgi:EmrB/QacA subfamily drug resistance transporter